MKTIEIKLPEEIERYMESCSEERGSFEWFQEAFCAVTRRAMDKGASLTEEFNRVFASRIADEDEINELAEKMMIQSGLSRLN